MRILHATRRPIFPAWFGGGAERATHAMLSALSSSGDTCEALGEMRGPWSDLPSNAKLSALGVRGVEVVGYRSVEFDVGYRARITLAQDFEGLLRERLRKLRPTHVWTHLEGSPEIVRIARSEGVAVVWYLHDAQEYLQGTDEIRKAANDGAHFVACSPFVAQRARELQGVSASVVYPAVSFADYVVRRPNPTFVTMVNPVPVKGLDTFLQIAELMSEQQFMAVEGWRLRTGFYARVRSSCAALPNIVFRESVTDMRSVYAETRILIVPSVWEEAFGRVVLEAQASGIPVIASRRGGLADFQNGIVHVDDYLDPVEWVVAIQALLADPARMARLSSAAERSAREPQYAAEGAAASLRRAFLAASDPESALCSSEARAIDGLERFDHEVATFLDAARSPSDRVRAVPGIRSKSGEHDEVTFAINGAVHTISDASARAIAVCNRFRTLDEHASEIYYSRLPDPESSPANVRQVLEHLMAKGLLVSLEQVTRTPVAETSREPPPLSSFLVTSSREATGGHFETTVRVRATGPDSSNAVGLRNYLKTRAAQFVDTKVARSKVGVEPGGCRPSSHNESKALGTC